MLGQAGSSWSSPWPIDCHTRGTVRGTAEQQLRAFYGTFPTPTGRTTVTLPG